MDTLQKRALVFLAHGSRDPAWKLPIETIAAHAGSLDETLETRCAYLDMTVPDMASCVAELAATGVTRIAIVPVFLGMGQHLRTDLPRLLADVRARFPDISLVLQSAVGENPEVLKLIGKSAVDNVAIW